MAHIHPIIGRIMQLPRRIEYFIYYIKVTLCIRTVFIVFVHYGGTALQILIFIIVAF